MAERFDAIVVGAGPAGALAARTLATQQRSVLLVERGEAPGASGASAGLLRGSELARPYPSAPDLATERTIVEERIMLLDPQGGVSFDFRDQSRGASPPTVRSMLAYRLAGQLAEQAVAAGATLRTNQLVEVSSSGRSVALRLGGGEVTATAVIFTDPASAPSPPAPRRGPGPEHRVEATFRLAPGSIERRLGVRSGEGASLECLLPPIGPSGHVAGSVIPATDRLVVSVTVGPGDVPAAQRAFDAFVGHPSIAPYLKGAEEVERRTYLRTFPPPVALGLGGPGFLRAGECLGLDDPSGAFAPGVGWALRSGLAAAEVAGSPRGPDLNAYARSLRTAGVAGAMRVGRELHLALQRNPRLHGAYPGAMSQALHELMSETGARKQSVVRTLRAVRRSSKVGWATLAGDGLTLGRVL